MKNINDKTKKWLLVASGITVSAVLVTLIALQFKTPPIEDADIPQNSSDVQSIVVDTPNTTDNADDNISVPPIEIPKKTESSNGDDTGTEQTIQPNVPQKPNYTEKELTNPNQKPNGEKVQPPTEENPTPPQTQEPPKEQPSKPTGGLPGFDNVPNTGENQGEYLEDMYENGNKVGIMD